MMILRLPKLALALTLAGAVALPVLAQSAPLPPLAAVEDGQLIVHGAGGDTTVPVEGYDNIGELRWSPDGQRLLFVAFDQNHNATLLLTNMFGDVPRTVASPIAIGFPATFADASTVLYARDHASAPEASGDWLIDIFRTGLTEGAEPELVGSFASQIGCGGGSPYPADWQYELESGFVGNPLILAQTPVGIVHSASCAGEKTALLDTTTGEDQPIGFSLARVSVSPDGTKLVGIEIAQGTADGQPQRTLVTVDLATLTETTVTTAAMPDQVTWSADGSALFYSSREATGKVALTAAEQQAFAQATFIDTGVDRYSATLHRIDLPSGQETTLAQLDAFIIGRLSAAPDGKSLYFSTVANMDGWAKGIANHTIDLAEMAQQTAAVPVTLYQIDLSGGQPVMLADTLQSFTLNRAAMR